MWRAGAFVASLALNAFVTLLLRTQDPGNDNTWRLSGAALALHMVGVLQVLVPSWVYAFVQWACSAPLLCWLLVQLLGTLPPGYGAPPAQRLYRIAALEVALALIGLVLLVTVDNPLVRVAMGVVSITALAFELVPMCAPQLVSQVVPWLVPAPAVASATPAGTSTGSSSGSPFSGSWAPRPSPRLSQRGGGGLGTGSGLAGTGTGQSLPTPMEVLVCAMAVGKMLQAISVAAGSVGTCGRGLTLLAGESAVLPSILWSFSTSLTLYGMPLAICMYYGLVRYAACMLVARRSALRRVSSLGFSTLADDAGAGAQGRSSIGGGLLPTMRRMAAHAAAAGGGGIGGGFGGGGGGDSDSDSGLPVVPSRMLDVGDLYRITESSGHSVSYSTSGDEGWRTDLALTQLLYMARTTFHRSSTEEMRPADGGAAGAAVAGTPGGGAAAAAAGEAAAGGAAAEGMAAAAATKRSAPPPPRPQTTNASCQTEPNRPRVSFGGIRREFAVQCELAPTMVVKEVQLEVQVPVPVVTSGGGGDAALMALLHALREHSSDIAHDMKNPLNGVLALSQNVLMGTFGEVPSAAGDQLGVVRACAYHLLNMINQLRDCLKMLHGGEPDGNCGRVQLSNAIEEVLKRMSPMVGSRLTITPEHDTACIVYADDGRLYQAVHTVLANAFKYTRKGGVTIETATNADKTTVTLRVVDTGTGFSAEQMEKFNGPLSGSPEEQLGLGLTMVKRSMAYFGGILRLGNRSSGTTGGWVELIFRTKEEVPALGFGLPPPPPVVPTAPSPPLVAPPPAAAAAAATAAAPAAAAATAAAPAAPTSAKEPSRKLRKSFMDSERHGIEERLVVANSSNDTGGRSAGGRGGGVNSSAARGSTTANGDDTLTKGDELVRVLIVDDDPVNLTILEDLLGAEGYDVLTAASGTEALEVYLTSDPQPKLVLLDVTLPDMSGHEVCLKMRSLTPGVAPPIIMISGKASTKDVIKGLQAGACDYITKPFQPQEVMARVETQLRLFMGEVAQLQEAAERNMALLRQILPPHILASLRGGTRVLVEKFSDVVVLCADVVGFSALAAAADTADCIVTLNRLFSTFDSLTDKMGVHKMDCHTDSYVAALGHMPQDRHISNVMQVKQILDLAREMLAAVDTLPYPDTLGKMQIRIGVHVGAVYGGVIGIKYPRYSLFGTTLRLAQGLQATALPNTIHVTEVVHNRVRAAGGETFTPYTTSQVQSLGIIRTYLVGAAPDGAGGGMLDYAALDNSVVVDYLRNATASAHGITVLSCLLGGGAAAAGNNAGLAAASGFGGAGAVGLGGGGSAATGGNFGLGGLTAGPRTSRLASGCGSGSGNGSVGAVAAAPAPPPPPIHHHPSSGSAAYKIIPVISGRQLGGDDGGGGGGGVQLPGSSRDSDGSGYAITLAQVAAGTMDQGGQEIMSTMVAVASGDMGSMASMDSYNTSSLAPPAITGVGNSASASTASGGAAAVAVGPTVHAGFSGSAAGGAASLAATGAAAAAAGGRRHTSDASLVQDLSPGPTAAGLSSLTRLQRMHAPQTLSPVPGSGAGSPRHSRTPSRNSSFRLGGGGGGGASPLAATVMQQQLLTALQQQQQQAAQQASAQMAAAARSSREEGMTGMERDGASAGSPQSTSEPLMKIEMPNNAAAARTTGISSATMRKIHAPLKAASISALPASVAGGDAGGGHHKFGGGVSSAGGSINGGFASTAGSIGSPPHFFSPGHTRADLSVAAPGNTAAAGGSSAGFGASPYSGLSSETRARLARLRTASQPDLLDVVTAGDGVPPPSAPVSFESKFVPTGDRAAGHGGGSARSLHTARTAPGSMLTQPQPAAAAAAAAAAAQQQLLPMQQRSPTQPQSASQSASQSQSRRPPQQRPSTVGEMLDALGLSHYSRAISGAVVGGLDELASLDDGALRKVGLVSSRSRQLVQDELRRWGYK